MTQHVETVSYSQSILQKKKTKRKNSVGLKLLTKQHISEITVSEVIGMFVNDSDFIPTIVATVGWQLRPWHTCSKGGQLYHLMASVSRPENCT